MSQLPTHRPQDRLDLATADLDPPFALLDLDALDANADDLVRRYPLVDRVALATSPGTTPWPTASRSWSIRPTSWT